VLTTLKRRLPRLPVVVYPTPVQGEGAAGRIAAAIADAGGRQDCDVLIVCRGGGSIEDLWAFNEEIVARAILACGIPVVSGIGHETDFTIADFVADVRAPTPTAAAELASPDRQELSTQLLHIAHRLSRDVRRGLEGRMQRLDYLSRRLVHPGERIRNQLGELRHLVSRLAGAWARSLEERGWRLREAGLRLAACAPAVAELQRNCSELARRLRDGARRRLEMAAASLARVDAHLKHLNPQSVLERGYSITHDRQGRLVRDARQLAAGVGVRITLSRGWADASVERTGNEDDRNR
jgi:exodeoxyribonuclease VII large subunit